MYQWLSECCEAPSMGEMAWEGEEGRAWKGSGEAIGFCSRCLDNSLFFLEDAGEPFDTKEEKYGER